MIIVKNISEEYGGNGGKISNDFKDIIASPIFGGSLNITKINISSVTIFDGDVVDSLQITYNVETEDGKTIPYLSNNKYGKGGGGMNSFTLVDGEQISRITGRYGQYLDFGTVIKYIQFLTKKSNHY